MIQRIQTVFLVLGAVALAALLLFDVVWTSAATAQGWFTPAVIGIDGLAIATALGAIFLYKNRPKQRRVIVVAQVLTTVLLLVFCVGLYLANALYVRTARRGVEKDINLVQSMDRLR